MRTPRRAQSETGDAQHGEVVVTVEREHAGRAGWEPGPPPRPRCRPRRRPRGRSSPRGRCRPSSRSPRSPGRRRCRSRARRCGPRPCTAGSPIRRGSGGATPGAGPVIEGSGSRRASAPRIGPDGGSSSLSSRRITERWMSARSCDSPAAWAATAAAIHTIPRPTATPRAAPSTPSSTPSPGSSGRGAV